VTVKMASRLVQSAWSAYSASMAKRPMVTGMVTSWSVMTAGDAVAQYITTEKRHPMPPAHTKEHESGQELFGWFDWKRNIIVSSWNGLAFAPSVQIWFGKLDRWFPGSSFRMAASKVVTNTMVMAYPFNAMFLAFTMTAERALGVRDQLGDETLTEAIKRKITDDAFEIFCKSAMVWAPINMLNFMYVSPKFRVLPTIVASLFWNVILSLIAHRELATSVTDDVSADPSEQESTQTAHTTPVPSSIAT